MKSSEWVKHAACRGMPIEVFFVERGKNTREAKKVCSSCSVVPQCLESALAMGQNEDEFGVFGGLSPSEREKIRRKRASGIIRSKTLDNQSSQT